MRTAAAVLKMLGLCLLAGVLLAGMLFPVAGGLGLTANQASDTVDSVSADLVEGDLPLVTTLTDKDGAPIAHLYEQYRVPVSADQISPAMKAAIIAIEDRRFFEHQGVDWKGTTRALVTNQLAGEVAQGGSTLTMQYVKNYLLYVVAQTKAEQAQVTEQTPARKLREIRIATQLETQLSKEEILSRYLNIVFFGNGAYGVAAAASTYFGVPADQLTIAQSALLAGMVKSTTEYDPVKNPDTALVRRNLVIDAMAEVKSISPDAAAAAKAEPIGIVNPLNSLPNGCVGAGTLYGHFCQYALDYLNRLGIPEDQLKRGGYVIKTTLDPKATQAAKAAAEGQVPKTADGIANAMAIVQPAKDKHRVLALAANRDYGNETALGQSSYRLPSDTTKFGAGSIYKVFTAAAALEMGMGINWEIDVPPTYQSSVFYGSENKECQRAPNGARYYCLKNAGNYPAQMTLQDALAQSPNTGFVKLLETVTVKSSVEMASRLGMREAMNGIDSGGNRLQANSGVKSRGQQAIDENQGAFVLGPGPTGVLELANVSATIMSGGVWCPPTPLESVTDARTGQPVPVNESPCEQAVPEGLANSLAHGMSKDDLPGGTANAAARDARWNRPMIGKTGTTQSHQSAGFMGATPQYAGAVMTWADGVRVEGICDGDIPRLCGDRGNIYGGKVPARTWFNAMTPLHEGLPRADLPPADPKYVDGGSQGSLPNVVGRSFAEAKSILEQAGFRVSQRERDDAAPKGTVVGQTPRSRALPGSMITLYVSNGTAPPAPPPGATPPGEGDPGGGGGGGGGGGNGGGGNGGGGFGRGPGNGGGGGGTPIPGLPPPGN